jgi:hypothetical protein
VDFAAADLKPRAVQQEIIRADDEGVDCVCVRRDGGNRKYEQKKYASAGGEEIFQEGPAYGFHRAKIPTKSGDGNYDPACR